MNTDQIEREKPVAERAEQARAIDSGAIASKVTELEAQARTLVGQRPIVALLATVGIGYLFARLVGRGSR